MDKNFSDLNINSSLISTLVDLGYNEMTPIQSKSLPVLLEGKDIIGQAETGSGKTAAFAIPILNSIDMSLGTLQGLVLCPTRELATQVVNEFRKIGRKLPGLQVLQLTGGGVTGREQIQAIENGVHIAVGTPGRILDLIENRGFDLSNVKTLVMDEADKMLDMGFEKEIGGIMDHMPSKRQTIFFSATFPETIEQLSKQLQKNPVMVKIEKSKEATANIHQIAYEYKGDDKLGVLFRVLQQHAVPSALIFCNTKASVAEVTDSLLAKNASCACLHGDLEQRDRDKVMAMFRGGSIRILVATDVAARGIDIENLELVVNYDFPAIIENYIHRIGRTGRAGKQGTAVTLVLQRETLKLLEYERTTGQKIEIAQLGFKNQHGVSSHLQDSSMKTIHLSAGRKDKIRAGDILGALTGKDCGLRGEDIGKIEIHDQFSYVAVKSNVAEQAIAGLRQGRIKNKKFPVRFLK